jgi:2,3-dihydroxybenzoate decarboxylase
MKSGRREFIARAAALSVAVPASLTSTGALGSVRDGGPPQYKRVATEEGFSVPEIAAETQRMLKAGRPLPNSMMTGQVTDFGRDLFARLLDIGAGRVAVMDQDGIAKQLLLLSAPGVQAFDEQPAIELARLVNERAAAAVRAYPDRFAALTTIAPQNPTEAAREFERGVKSLGFKGALINSHTHGEYLDDRKFWPIFEVAQSLDAPIYIHPREPSPQMAAPLALPGFNVGWGYEVEVGTHILRLIHAGVFDQFPKLTLVIGHLGEGLPYILDRLDNRFTWEAQLHGASGPRRLPSEYLRENVYITTSGMNTWHPVRLAIEMLGIERVLFAVDYPFETGRPAVARMDAAPFSAADREKFYHANAERVFKL